MKAPRLVGGARDESYALYALAGALLLAGPVWHYLYVERYPPRVELLLLVGVPALVGALAAVAGHRVGGLVESLGFGLLLFLFLDLQFDLQRRVRVLVLLGAAVALSVLLRRRRAAITAVTLGVFYLAALPRATTTADDAAHATRDTAPATVTGGSAALPVIVHVVLDEQWGIGGLRAEGDSATAAWLTDFYLRRGFEVYPAAYSRYHHTFESIPSIVSLGRPGARARVVRRTPDAADPFPYRLLANPYFDLLRADGYAVRVLQPSYIDFCAVPNAPVASCHTWPGNSIANVGRLDGSPVTRALLAARFFLNLNSHVYARLRDEPEVWRRGSVGSGVAELRRLRDDVARGPRAGVVHFVHALVPHRPLEVDADCRALGDMRRRVLELPPEVSDATWRSVMALEGGQIRCAHRELAAALDAIDGALGRGRAIVIVHGDHGSRVFQRDPKQAPPSRLDARQLNGRYATLLAVRRPGVPGRVVAEPVPVQDFLWRLAGQHFRGPVAPDFAHYVLAGSADRAGADSVATLSAATMPWAR